MVIRALRTAGALVLMLTVPLVATASAPVVRQAGAPATARVSTWEYLPGVAADLYLPTRVRAGGVVPVVVMVPGGAWQTADRSGLSQLAERLAFEGVAVSNTTYRIGTPQARFPVPAQDVTCAVDASVAAVRQAGLRPGRVVLLGHSAGAHLSSLAAFGASRFRTPQCRHPQARVDGWVGLAGIYDLTAVGHFAATMMGGTADEDPELYAKAATRTYLNEDDRTRIRALVIQGDADEYFPTSVATDFAALLREHGYDTRLEIIPGADHMAVFQASVLADTLLSWLR